MDNSGYKTLNYINSSEIFRNRIANVKSLSIKCQDTVLGKLCIQPVRITTTIANKILKIHPIKSIVNVVDEFTFNTFIKLELSHSYIQKVKNEHLKSSPIAQGLLSLKSKCECFLYRAEDEILRPFCNPHLFDFVTSSKVLAQDYSFKAGELTLLSFCNPLLVAQLFSFIMYHGIQRFEYTLKLLENRSRGRRLSHLRSSTIHDQLHEMSTKNSNANDELRDLSTEHFPDKELDCCSESDLSQSTGSAVTFIEHSISRSPSPVEPELIVLHYTDVVVHI